MKSLLLTGLNGRILFLSLIGIFIAGVTGFVYLCGYEIVDAIYMTIITITTVGFKEVIELNEDGKIFVSLLIVCSVGVYALVLNSISQMIKDGRVLKEFKFKKKMNKIAKLKDHVIVCGFGRNGKETALRLEEYNKHFVVVEKTLQPIENKKFKHAVFLEGDAAEDETLDKAGLSHASALVTTLPSDSENLYIVMAARQKNSKLTIISRASSDSSVKKLKFAGASNVIMPDKLGGGYMASVLVTPNLIGFLNQLILEDVNTTNLIEISGKNISEQYHYQALKDLDLERSTECIVIGFKSENGDYIVNPSPTTIIEPNSSLIVLGNSKQIEKALNTFRL